MNDFSDSMDRAEADMVDAAARSATALWTTLRFLGVATGLGGAATGAFAAYEGVPIHGTSTCVMAGCATFLLARTPGWRTLKGCAAALATVPVTATALSFLDGVGRSALPAQAALVAITGVTALVVLDRVYGVMTDALRRGSWRIDREVSTQMGRISGRHGHG